MILGAVLAGGQSTRFGSDKALAELGGRTLLARAVEALEGMCDAVVVIGRETAPAPTLPDWPRAGMGPLGGIAAALHHARDAGYEAVLTCSVDGMGLGDDLLAQLGAAP
ncbi:MAG: molybdenum cofactor guanylyltransferase, partial [Novosphingobium sp.]|nr:molybdenum cofactor guanylyltransferase [Novosphingobium sp.]